ncbi:MAG: bifunctional precorrin-2 dehydrogenase/sirohydrochlorin ferrochelatase, partial [Chitinophagaceae bacterium]
MADTITAVNKNQLYPVFLKLHELKLLLVGGGNVGLEKLNSLLSNSPDTNITIVAPLIRDEVKELVAKHPYCKLVERRFEESDLDGMDLAICATDDKDLHASIKYLANEKGILVNVADTPDLCDFYLGSIVQKGQLKIAISTNGKSPTAAKRIREVLNDALPAELDEVIENLNQVRNSLNGDFEYKVKRMNEITKTLIQKNGNGERDLRWKRVATYSLLAFAFMLIGYFIFSYIPFQSIADGTVKWYHTLDKAFP